MDSPGEELNHRQDSSGSANHRPQAPGSGSVRDRLEQGLWRSARLLGEALLGPVDRLGQLARPAGGLIQRDRALGLLYLRNAMAMQDTLGTGLARDYGRLLDRSAALDVLLARELAELLPMQLARVEESHRRRLLDILEWTIQRRPRLVLPVAQQLPVLLSEMNDRSLRRFLEQGMKLHLEDQRKLASFLRVESDAALTALKKLRRGLALKDVLGVLSLYARAHCGEDVRILSAGSLQQSLDPVQGGRSARAFTDGHDIYLPDVVDMFGDERDFQVYRVGTAHAAGYLEFGTFDLYLDDLPGEWPNRRPGESELERLFRSMPRSRLARNLFQVIEDTRVLAALDSFYPGVARARARLTAPLAGLRPDPASLGAVERVLELLARRAWAPDSQDLAGLGPVGRPDHLSPMVQDLVDRAWERIEPVKARGKDVAASAQLLVELYPMLLGLEQRASNLGPPPRDIRTARAGRFRRRRASPPHHGKRPVSPAGFPSKSSPEAAESAPPGATLAPQRRSRASRSLDERIYSVLDKFKQRGEAASYSQVRRVLRSSRVPVDYREMEAWLASREGPSGGLVEDREPPAPSMGQLARPLKEGVMEPSRPGRAERLASYHEWDAGIGDYKPDWVRVMELPLAEGSEGFVQQVMSANRSMILTLRRQFEALRPRDMALERALSDGDSLDLDRVVSAVIARRTGDVPSDRLYQRKRRDRRDVAVAFLLDMSSSTNEVVGRDGKRVIQVEKEALVLMAEALEAIGDSFAIFGFSGYGRDQVAFYVAKDFHQPHGAAIRRRIGRMGWRMENRDGAAIRHATARLDGFPAQVKLLMILSDGKPLDCGCHDYHDRYAQEDTRMALREARKMGVHPFCITVDPQGREYLRRMYGETGYTIIDRIEALPARLPRIYRRLST